MEVTRENFNEVFPTLEDVFSRAQFLTFDTEFTGLRIEGAIGGNYFDTLDDLYLKDRFKAETFMALQFGVVAFFYDASEKRYTHQAYNFYIFPSAYSDSNFTCESKSIAFLIENGFDFNKVFSQGISYLKDCEVEKLLEKLEEKQEKPQQQFQNISMCETTLENSEILNSVLSQIEEILNSNSKKTFKIEKSNRFLRRLIYCTVQNKYGLNIFMETNKDDTMTIAVGYSTDEIKDLQTKSYIKEKNKIVQEAGFSRVIKLIMGSKKLLIGHNLRMDILFTIRQFLTPLPDSYSEFKQLVNFLFPKIIDTKFMVSTMHLQSLKDTSLYNIIEYYQNAKKIPEIEIAKGGQGYSFDDKSYHEAAYDAYLTGLAFVAMFNDLGLDMVNFENLLKTLPLNEVINKLAVPKMHDISYMNLGGTDVEPDRNGVYHLTFPKEWKRDNITDLFKNCGFVNVSWINSTSAFVKVKNAFIDEVEKTLMNSNNSYKLCTYEKFKTNNYKIDNLPKSPLAKNTGSNLKKDLSFMRESNVSSKKRQIEDIGEVIQRPTKKLSVS